MCSARFRRVYAAQVLALASVSVLGANRIHGQTVATWLNPTSGSWQNANLWSTDPIFPNNDPGSGSFNAILGATGSPYTVTSNLPVTIESLLLSSLDATLAITTKSPGFLR